LKQTRLELALTRTLRHDGANKLPPVRVIGADDVRLPILGRGSARVFSPPVRPRIIGGQPYLLLDMGVNPTRPPVARAGVEGLYGRSVPLDPRYLTSYVRDVSLVSGSQFDGLRAPEAVASFPGGLADPDLEYSGIYEDGWLSEDSYVVLAGGGPANFVVRADVLPRSGGQYLVVLVNGRPVYSMKVAPGALSLRVPLAASRGRRRIELRWAGATRLRAPDLRPATALAHFIGLTKR
jgi:hypothetical protein